MKQEFVTLPRDVVKQAVASIEMLNAGKWTQVTALAATLRAALEQPQNHVSDAGNMVPAGWKLVPMEPTDEMLQAFKRRYKEGDFWRARITGAVCAMLAAAPQPPTTEDCSVVQPQANQPAMTPIAQRKLDSLLAEGYTISGYSVYHEQKHQHGFVTGAGLVGWWKPDGVEYPQPKGGQEPALVVAYDKQGWRQMLDDMREIPDGTPLYTHQLSKREPLTNEQVKVGLIQSIECTDVRERCAFNIGVRFAERAHNIK